jgi:peptide/nickel transport system permease protein
MLTLRYCIEKLCWALLTLVVVVVLNFFLFRILPGDPCANRRIGKEASELCRKRYHLDQPVAVQFFSYVSHLLHFDLGESYTYKQPVLPVLRERLWNTLWLILPGQILAILIGIAAGIWSASKLHTTVDYTLLGVGLITWSLPTFWFGLIVLFVGTTYLGLPGGGLQTPGQDFAPFSWQHVYDTVRHLILPTLTFTLVFVGEYLLIMRNTLLDIFTQDYIFMAKANGLPNKQIIWSHVLPNTLPPLLTIILLNLGLTMAGAIEIEIVFSLPGLGQAIVKAVSARDYPLLQGIFLLLSSCVIFANFLAEVCHRMLDPRHA